MFAETSDVGATTGGGTANEDEEPQCGDAAADGDAVHGERAPYEGDCHPERNHQGELQLCHAVVVPALSVSVFLIWNAR